jgi:uncharacterized protein (TIGR02246 family)
MFKTLSATAIGLVFLASPSFAHNQADATKAVATFVSNYEKLFNAKDARGLAGLFADDAVQAAPGPLLTNRDDIEKRYKKIFDAGNTDFHVTVKQVQAEGNLVFMVGQFSVKSPQGGMHEIGGNVVDIFEWDGDALKFRVLSFNVSPPPAQR